MTEAIEDTTAALEGVTDVPPADEAGVANATAAPDDPNSSNLEELDQETFPREYVEKLRAENGKYRQKAGRVDELAQRLHTALVAATGKLADPTDLPFQMESLDDPDALNAAIDALLASKPHLKNRIPTGDIGQGMSEAADSVTLAGLLRASAN